MNTAASIRQRLLNQARTSNRPFNELLQHYAMERLLYRLSKSEYAGRFVLKGALLLRAWRAPSVRPTMDIDLLGRTSSDPANLEAVVRRICKQPVADDGLIFDAESVEGAAIVEEADYAGVRIRFRGALGTARITMQIDVGFGDVITPEPSKLVYPTLLWHDAPELLAYPRETVVAEKLQVMLHRRMLNSRLRDYYDIWLLSRNFAFDGALLARAIRNTCARRETEIIEQPTGLGAGFAQDPARQTQWAAFRRKSKLEDSPESLIDLVESVAGFLGPIVEVISQNREFRLSWNPPGPWGPR